VFIYHFNRLIRNRILWAFSPSSSPSPSSPWAPVSKLRRRFDGGTHQRQEDFGAAAGGDDRRHSRFGRNRDNETSASIVERRAWEQIAARLTPRKTGWPPARAKSRT
jgi:hypothetical protein